MNIFGFITSIFKPAADLVDAMHTSEEEKLQLKAAILQVQSGVISKAMQLEADAFNAKARVITTEASSDSFLTSNWRPMVMLALTAAVMGYWFGLTPDSLPEVIVNRMFSLVQIGIGGYIAGRSGEKIAKSVAEALKKKESV